MSKNRMGKINEEIMKELSTLIRNLKDPRVQGMVSITHVEVTPDMRFAKVFVSALGDEDKLKDVLKGLQSAGGFLRHELSQKVLLRYTPQLTFEPDHSITEGAHILSLLNKVIPPNPDNVDGENANDDK